MQLKSFLFSFSLLSTGLAQFSSGGQVRGWVSPVYKHFYEFAVPIPPVKQPLATYTKPNGGLIDYYEVKIQNYTSQVYPELGPAAMVGYDGISPGPTFVVKQGRETVVRFINIGNDKPTATHLHGSYSHAPWDGWAEDLIPVGSYKDYYYPNGQNARTLWYHDHAMDHTAENAYFGQAGFYIITDDNEPTQGLPMGKYDIGLALSSKQYKKDGSLLSPAGETWSLFGDVIHVNGQPWPYLPVEPRKYRFRLLNTALSRSFRLYLVTDLSITESDTANHIPFHVVGSDSGRTDKPVQTSDLWMSMGERWEVVIDFESFAGKSLYLKNFFKTEADVAYAATNQVMRFDIGTTVTDNSNNGPLPAAYNPLPVSTAKYDLQKPDHKFHFDYRGEWTINGVTFNDVKNRILAAPPRGTTQLWQLSTSRGWSHPIHLHLVDFKVVARTGGSRTSVLEYEKAGMKDVVLLGEGETVWVLATYAPWEGVYMFHCHNLVHEDHAMMAVFNVSSLEGFNYPANNLKFIDPLDPRFRARPWAQEVETLDLVKGTVLPAFAGLGAYDDIEGVEKALDAFVTTATGLKDDKPVRK